MTQKQRAKDLVNKIYQPLGYLDCRVSSQKMWDYSKDRAIEFIEFMLDQVDFEEADTLHFSGVKNEIKNL